MAVMVHLEHGTAAAEVLDLLEADGVPADRVVLAHADRLLDPGWHLELARRGAYLGYDGAARHRPGPRLRAARLPGAGGRGRRGRAGPARRRRRAGEPLPGVRGHPRPGLPADPLRPAPGRPGRARTRCASCCGTTRCGCSAWTAPAAADDARSSRRARPRAARPYAQPPRAARPAAGGGRAAAGRRDDRVARATRSSPSRPACWPPGLQTVEITLRTAAGLPALRALAAVPGLVVGAGTVLDVAQADAAIAAGRTVRGDPGAQRGRRGRLPRSRACPVLPGVATPTEVMRALDLGLTLLKLFPAEVLGGVGALRALGGPFPQVRFMPTGGVSLAQPQGYLDLPDGRRRRRQLDGRPRPAPRGPLGRGHRPRRRRGARHLAEPGPERGGHVPATVAGRHGGSVVTTADRSRPRSLTGLPLCVRFMGCTQR